ncbi:MAG TPA: hypothetical protein PKM44_12025 [Turneriella sp.]|nr:hypothetical protein [Turneriella sp.]HNE21256.1 hypothetical protein [Turneriella sp.]HNL11234.1 hypothetical protein [Turneriella sp.]HNL54700.1 hypothetical protein [Turneriella sp.]
MPESKYEFDQTRAAIGANELDNAERREMLERFKSAGGQVLREKSVAEKQEEARRAAEARSAGAGGVAARPAGGGGGAIPETKLPSELRREQAREEADRAQRARAEYEKALKKLKGPGARFMVKLRCFLAGITPFAGNVIKPGFVQFLNLELKQALIEFNLIGNDLFLQRPSIGKKIMHNLDGKNPLLMETLEYAHHMYNSEYFNTFATAAQNGAAVPVESAAAAIKSIYRTLYILYPFQETFRKAMGYALDVFTPEAQAAKLSQESLQGMILKQKRFHANTKIAFQTAFPKLFHLVCLADGTDYPPFSPLLEKAIQVAQNDKLGQRKKGDGSTLESQAADQPVEGAQPEEKAEEKKEEEKKGGIYDTKEYQYGFSLMKMRNPQQLVERYDKSKRMLEKVPINDRILLSYLYFMEFDYEYSFVLTTNKISINVDYSGGVKSDYKKQMADLYNESRAIIKAYEKYEEMLQEYRAAKDRKSSNYIEKSKLEEKAKGRADMEGRNTRGLIRAFMDNVAKSMAYLIADMKGAKQIVANMDEAVKFDAEFEKGKRLNGKPVKQCIMDAYCFAVAFKERLANGDLFPLTPMTDEEMQSSFGQSFGVKAAETPDTSEI